MGTCSSNKKEKKPKTLTDVFIKRMKSKGEVDDENELGIKLERLIGSTGGNYQDFYTLDNEKPLGKGTYGEVFKVTHKISKLSRAMKIINKKESSEQKDLEIRNEIEILIMMLLLPFL